MKLMSVMGRPKTQAVSSTRWSGACLIPDIAAYGRHASCDLPSSAKFARLTGRVVMADAPDESLQFVPQVSGQRPAGPGFVLIRGCQ